MDGFGAECYVRIIKLFNDNLQNKLDPLLEACDPTNHILFLHALNNFWLEYCEQLVKNLALNILFFDFSA